jgi:uncharacterized protein with von Willebrand factor type A (vWA) domain
VTSEVSALPELLTDRVVRFGRLLRAAGLSVGPGRILVGMDALTVIDVTRREDVFWALHASWVRKPEDRDVYEQAFRLYWRDPDRPVNRVLEELLAASRLTPEGPPPRARRRVLEALNRDPGDASGEDRPPPEPELIRTAFSDREVLRQKDFEQMSSDELAEAKRMLERMRLPTPEIRVRRWRSPTARGAVDMRRTLRDAARRGGTDFIPLSRRRPRTRTPTLVCLCDISGSMAGYSRMLLRFLHALTSDRDQVHTFLFGTRLSNVTRFLRHRDPDATLSEVGRRVRDWEGGTRIGPCLHDFNRQWGRRLLAQGAVVLLITDGLDRDDPNLLASEMERLRASCRRLIWLNPLLRYAEFSPEARGIRAMLPHVDDFRPVHNLASLEALADALGERRGDPLIRRGRAASA